MNRTDMESWYKLKVQEIQTQSTRQNLEQGYAKEEVKRLRVQLSELRGKLADLEGRVSKAVFLLLPLSSFVRKYILLEKCFFFAFSSFIKFYLKYLRHQ